MYFRIVNTGLVRKSTQSFEILLCVAMASSASLRSSMHYGWCLAYIGLSSFSTSILNAWTFCGRFFPVNIFSTPPNAVQSISCNNNNNNNNNNCLKSNIQCIEIRVQWTVPVPAINDLTLPQYLINRCIPPNLRCMLLSCVWFSHCTCSATR